MPGVATRVMIAGMVLEAAPQQESAAARSRRGIRILLAVVVVLGLAYGALWLVAKPNSPSFRFATMRANYGSRVFSQIVVIDGGGRGERISGISVSGTAVELVGPVLISSPGLPARNASRGVDFPAHSRLRIETRFRVTDCRNPHLSIGPLPLQIHLRRLWFSETDTVVDHGQDFPDAGRACGLYH